jgi:hypothetical protein
MVADDVRGRPARVRDDEKSSEEEQTLHPAAAQQALVQPARPAAARVASSSHRNGQAPERAGNVQNVADAAESDGLGQLVGGRV